MSSPQSSQSGGGLSDASQVSERLMAALDAARSRMNSKVKDSHLKTALAALVKATNMEAFQNDRRRTMERAVVLSDPSASALEDDNKLLSDLMPWFDLAEAAYEPETDVLKATLLDQHGYELHTHKKAVECADVGYYVALNHTANTVLIGVKGTSSLADAITDCVAVTLPRIVGPPCPYTLQAEPREIRCHEGILTAAVNLCDDVSGLIPEGYRLVLTGHSLGAGTAALLGILLRSRGTQDLHVYAFACPPVADLQSCRESKTFITSIVNKSDVVPRCSISNLDITTNLLEELATMMKESEAGKSGISGNKGILALKKAEQKLEEDENPLSIELLGEFLNKSQEAVQLDDPDHLYVPGKVVMFYDHLEASVDDKDPSNVETKACIVDGSHKALRMVEFNGMNTISDHYCDSYRNSFQAKGVVSPHCKEEDSNKEKEEEEEPTTGVLCGGCCM